LCGPRGRAYPIHSYWRLPSQVACIREACGRAMKARSDGFQYCDVAPAATLVFAPAIPAELAPTSKPRKSPALVPTATWAFASRTATYMDAVISMKEKTRSNRTRGASERAKSFVRIG